MRWIESGLGLGLVVRATPPAKGDPQFARTFWLSELVFSGSVCLLGHLVGEVGEAKLRPARRTPPRPCAGVGAALRAR